MTLLAWEMSAIVQYFEHFWALPSFEIGTETDFFQSLATAAFSRLAGILSAVQINWNSITSNSFIHSDAS